MSRARRGSQASARRRNRASFRSRGLHSAERLELRTLMAGDVVNPFHNAHFAPDVNGDWQVTSLDAVLIINNLNATGARELPVTSAARTMAEGEGTETSPEYLDVNGDGFLTPLDALLVINHLNAEGADPAIVSYRNVVRGANGQELPKTGSGTTADPYVYAVAPGQRFTVTTEIRDNRIGTLDAPEGSALYNTAPLGLFETFSDLFFDSNVAKLGFSEVQRLTFSGVPGGGASMSLTVRTAGGGTTLGTTATFNIFGGTSLRAANAGLIEAALNTALGGAADSGQVSVTNIANTDTYEIKYRGKQVDLNLDPIVVNGLSAGTATVTTPFDLGGTIDLTSKANIVAALNYNALYAPELDPAGQRFLELYTPNANGSYTGILRTGGRATGDTAVSPRDPLPTNPDEYTDYMTANFAANDGYMIVSSPVFVAQGSGETFINTDAPGVPNDPSNHGTTATLAIGNVTGSNPLVTQDRIAYPANNSVKIVVLADVTADDDTITNINEDAPATVITAQILDGDTINQGGGTLSITGFGPNGTEGTFTIPNQGTVSLNAGVVTFTPALNFAGNFVFQYGLTNNGSATPKDFGLVTIVVNPVNDAPTAAPGNATTNEDVFVDIDLRTLVTDIETPVANLTFAFSNVTNGSVQILNGHTARFTPAANFSGVGSFDYTVTDSGQGASAALSASSSVTVTINPVNDAPVVTPVTQTTAEDTAINIDLASFVTDVETADNALVFSSVSVTNGTLTLVSGSSYTFTPALNFNGTAVLTFSVTDTGDGTAAATTVGPNSVNITVTPVDDPGTAPDQTVNVTEDVPAVLTLTGVTGGPTDESQVVTLGLPSATTAQGGTVTIVNNQIRYTSPANFYSARYGNDTFSYSVTDSSGATVTGLITVVVAADTIDPPQANDDGLGANIIEIPDAGITTLPLSTILGNDTNEPDTPDNNNLTVAITDMTGLPAGVTVSVNNATQELIVDATNFQVPQSGDVTATFQYSITDVDGNSDTATVTITLVPNTLPRAVDDSYTFSETDIEGDNTRDLNVIDGTLRPDREYANFADLRITGLSATEATSTDGSVVVGGVTFAIDASGRFITMTAPAGNLNLNGTFVLYYTLDEPGVVPPPGGDPVVQDIGKVTVTITPVNDAPTASPANATLNEDTVYTIDLRTLVTDLETIDDDLTFGVSGAQNGTVVVDADGYTARFTPEANYSGPASFTYTVTDGGDGASPALTASETVSLTYDPVNDAPVLTPVALATNEDADLLIDLSTLVSDVETADGNLVFSNVTATNGAIVLVSGSTYRFTPTTNFSGTATFSFDVTDTGQVGGDAETVSSGPLDITVNPVNDAPTADPDSDTTLEDTAITFDLRTLVGDVETAVADLTFAVSTPVGGTVVLDADGFTARFTPTANFNGNASFTYTVTDGGQGTSPALSASAQISITVTPDNDAPIVTPTAQTTLEDTELLIDLATMVTDVETADANLVFSDVVVTNGTIQLVSGTTYRYTPTANYNGPAELSFKVTDTGDGADAPIEVASGPIAITVTPVNDAPVATGDSETLAEDTVYTIDLRTLVTDVETDGVTRPFTFNVSNAVNGAVVLDADGFTARFTPTADYFGAASFTYTATDDGDNGAAAKTTAAQTISLTYTSVNDAPRPVNDAFTTFKTNNAGPTTLYSVLPNDIANQPFGETNETLTLTAATITSTTPAAANPNLPTVAIENGQLRFLPNGYAGTVVVTYTVSDGTLTSTATATFTVRDFEPGVISGYVYADFDGDTVMDGQVGNGRPERRLSDVEVWLVGKVAANVDPSQPTIAVMTRTDASGRFVFNNNSPGLTQGLPPGTYVVQLDNPNTPAVEGAELTIDSPDSIKSVSVPNQAVMPLGTGATVLGNNKIQVTFNELGINAELNMAVQGLSPRFMSIRDHLNTASPFGVVFAVNTADQSAAGHQYWYSIYENVNADGSLLSNPGWYGFQSLKLQVSANLSTAVLTAVDANGATWTRTLSFTADYTKIRVMGSEGSNVVVRLEGTWTDFFPGADTVAAAQQVPAAGEGYYAEGEGAAYAAAADEIYSEETWA